MNTGFDIDRCLDAFRRGDTKDLAPLLAPDFVFSGATPEPQGAAGFFGGLGLFFTAFPDLDWQLEVADASDDGFTVTTRTTGTHTAALDLTPQGIGRFEPTGRRFALPPQDFRWTLRDGAVSSIQATPAAGVGIPGVLAQLQLMPTPA